MIYLGHFSFDETGEEGRFGHFTSLVEAKNPEAATRVFKKLIKDMRKKKALFGEESIEIYFDMCIEVGAIPPTGLVTWYSSYSGEVEGRISTALPHEDSGGCMAYDVYPDGEDPPPEFPAKGPQEWKPFITFEPTAAQKRAAEAKAEMERLSRQTPPPARKPFAKKHW